jgi:hypothetical protein
MMSGFVLRIMDLSFIQSKDSLIIKDKEKENLFCAWLMTHRATKMTYDGVTV